MYIIPKEGFTIRDPRTKRILPSEGKEVPEDFFWVRRLRDGDVVRATPLDFEDSKVAAAPTEPPAPFGIETQR